MLFICTSVKITEVNLHTSVLDKGHTKTRSTLKIVPFKLERTIPPDPET